MSVHPSHPDIIKRLKRAEGHLRSIVTMLEEGRDCLEIAQQMQAVESAVGNAKRTLVHDHIDHCLEHAVDGASPRDAIREFKAITSTFERSIDMTDFSSLLQGGNAWLFIPSAIALGALHGLEPGHSKTMMAAFIIAVRGTLTQAILLGLAATVSHTAIVWLIALGGLYFGQHWSGEASEPYMQVVSAVLIVGVALWMMWRTSQNKAACFHDHGSDGGHDHDHHDHAHGHHDHDHETHDHAAHDHHDHDHDHPHDHSHDHAAPVAAAAPVYEDAHARQHAQQIQSRFANREVTTGQIVMFGLTGGLIPCPASITVLLLCLQLKRLALGAVLVLGFSVGLALTMVASGVIAALSVRHLARHVGDSSRISELARNAPYLSSILMLLVGAYVGWQGVHALMQAG